MVSVKFFLADFNVIVGSMVIKSADTMQSTY